MKNPFVRLASATLALAFALVLAACNGSNPSPPQGVAVSVSPRIVTLAPGGTQTFTAKVTGSAASNSGVTWTASGGTVTMGGVYTAPAATGVYTVTATSVADTSKNDTATVTVSPAGGNVPVTGVVLDKTTMTIALGGGNRLAASVQPSNATNQGVTWTSDKPGVATVTGGWVEAVANGTANITVTTSEGSFTATCAVTVVPFIDSVPVASVSLDRATMELFPGGSRTLTATVQPTNATNHNVTWSSDKPGVATVAGTGTVGTVTGVAGGTATITATTASGGKTATCAVIVYAGQVTLTLAPATIAAGGYHSLAQKTDGGIWAWGMNWWSQIGNGTGGQGQTQPSPVPVGADKDWASVVAGWGHTLAIKSNGSLWAWGNNISGAVGTGDAELQKNPLRVGVDNDWAAVSASGGHTLAIKTNGALWAWGHNEYGQLGDGARANRRAPVQVSVAVTAALAGYSHSLAIKADGSLWAWGYNLFGQLGIGTSGPNADKNTPVRVGTENNWVAVSCGNYHNLALKADGSLWAWGMNWYGQLGLGTSGTSGADAYKNAPVRVGTANDWVAVMCGGWHSLALKADGSLWIWGNNEYNQMGDDGSDRAVPFQFGTGYRVPAR